jgi:hypothetical protein
MAVVCGRCVHGPLIWCCLQAADPSLLLSCLLANVVELVVSSCCILCAFLFPLCARVSSCTCLDLPRVAKHLGNVVGASLWRGCCSGTANRVVWADAHHFVLCFQLALPNATRWWPMFPNLLAWTCIEGMAV